MEYVPQFSMCMKPRLCMLLELLEIWLCVHVQYQAQKCKHVQHATARHMTPKTSSCWPISLVFADSQHLLLSDEALCGPCMLQEFGVLPVLYASTWLLTAFSCPFSAAFAGRVIDIMLLEQRTHVLLRTALAVMADCEARLLELHDFEELITYLKVLTGCCCRGNELIRPFPFEHGVW